MAVPTGFAHRRHSSGGWFIGSGLEVAVAGGWYWRSEVRYADYSKMMLTDTNSAARSRQYHFNPVVETATSEIVYKFNWGH